MTIATTGREHTLTKDCWCDPVTQYVAPTGFRMVLISEQAIFALMDAKWSKPSGETVRVKNIRLRDNGLTEMEFVLETPAPTDDA